MDKLTADDKRLGPCAESQGNNDPVTVEVTFRVAAASPTVSLRSLRAETEIQAITQTLERTGWNRRRAAQLLSISYRGLLYKIHQHKITPRTSSQISPLAQSAKI